MGLVDDLIALHKREAEQQAEAERRQREEGRRAAMESLAGVVEVLELGDFWRQVVGDAAIDAESASSWGTRFRISVPANDGLALPALRLCTRLGAVFRL